MPPKQQSEAPKQRVGIFTGGGTAPGWNAVIYGAVSELQRTGNKAIGIREGWAGLLEEQPIVDFQRFTQERLYGLLRKGGSVLKSSRTKIEPPQYNQVWKMMRRYRLDGAIAIGGDDTLKQAGEITAAAQARNRNNDENLPSFIGVPKTVDDDVAGTERTFGFHTAVEDAAEQIRKVRVDAKTHGRVAAVELMGRDCGRITLHAGYVAGADITLIPEFPIPEQRLMKSIREIYAEQGFVVIALSEGYEQPTRRGSKLHSELTSVVDSFGHKKKEGAARKLLSLIKTRTKLGTMEQVAGYFVRSGAPIAPDGIFAAEMGAVAAHLADQRMYGRMVSLQRGRLTYIPMTSVSGGRHVTELEYNAQEMRKWDLPPNLVHGIKKTRGDIDAILRGQ